MLYLVAKSYGVPGLLTVLMNSTCVKGFSSDSRYLPLPKSATGSWFHRLPHLRAQSLHLHLLHEDNIHLVYPTSSCLHLCHLSEARFPLTDWLPCHGWTSLEMPKYRAAHMSWNSAYWCEVCGKEVSCGSVANKDLGLCNRNRSSRAYKKCIMKWISTECWTYLE